MAGAVALLAMQAGITIQGWEIYSDEYSCVAEKYFEDETKISISITNGLDDSDVTIWNKRWTSIVKDQRYSISIAFDSSPSQIFTGKGMKTSTSSGIFIDTDGLTTPTNAMVAKTMTLRRDNNLIGTYRLDGSKLAMRAVARCIGEKNSKVKSDPFAD